MCLREPRLPHHPGCRQRLRGRLADGDMAELGSLVGRALAPLVTMLDPDCVVVDARIARSLNPDQS